MGEIQVNEEVEHSKSEVSTNLTLGNREYEGKLKELQSRNDFMSMHGVSSSVVANEEVIITHWVLKEQGEGVKARLVIETFQHVERREQRFPCRNTNSSVVQFGSGFGSRTCRTGQVKKPLRVSMFPLRFFMRRCKSKSTSRWMQTLFVGYVKKTCQT